jgi:hypothetical protein
VPPGSLAPPRTAVKGVPAPDGPCYRPGSTLGENDPMRMTRLLASIVCLSAFALPACGGSQPPAEEPSAKKDDVKKDDAADGDDKKSDAADGGDKKSDAKKDDKKADAKSSETGMPEVKRTAKDIITAPEVTFMFSFNDSEPKEKAEKACSAESHDDPKKMAMCMKKASSKFEADGMQFKQEKGEWMWINIRRKGSTISVLHKVHIDFSDDKPTSVVVHTSGKDMGKGPGKVPSELAIEVPNEFQIAIKDPTFGRMVYEAKIGIMSDEKAK